MSGIDAILLGVSAYFVATVSPGPATLAIMSVSARRGRAAGLQLASGVICGSLFWGCCAALGLATVLARYSDALIVLKILGGTYLLWLAFKAFRSALKPGSAETMPVNTSRGLVVSGLAIHLTNPKAVLAWVAILSVGVQGDAPVAHSLIMFASCAVIGVCVFFGYAVLFSTRRAQELYDRMRRPLETLLGVAFGAAGLHLITGRT